ncbi:hypothetical protein TDB9533_04183 [Thalassocella blandensis]|nr:hypothetical protein TDB9533_04183 [Thalassocella blandensis]
MRLQDKNQPDKVQSMSKPLTENSGKAEQRDFFRVSQDVIFDYHVVDSFTADERDPQHEFESSISLNLLSDLRRLDKDSEQTLRVLTEKNRLLGDYLQTLSAKIDLIAKQVLFEQDKDKGRPKTRINLSEDGLAFLSDRMLYKNSYIALRLIFLPYYTPVTSFAQVIRCKQRDEKEQSFHTAVKFHRLSESDRRELARQIMRTQAQGRKKKQNEQIET